MTSQEAIQTLGLSEKEALVYLALLELGTGSAYKVAVRSGLKRPTAYVLLDELVSKGIIAKIPYSKTKLYRAKQPSFLFEEAREQLKEAEKELPKIQASAKDEAYKPQVFLYEGVEGIKEILDYKIEEMRDKTIYGFYATASNDIQKRFGYFKEEENKRKKMNILVKGIAPDDPKNLKQYRDTDKLAGREIKILSKEVYSSNISIEIGDNWVKTNDFENLQGLIIENPAFAKTMREIFEIIWKNT